MTRPDSDTYFMQIAEAVAERATCLHHNVGALLVRDKRILSTGYNGTPRGLPHCADLGCARSAVPSGTRHELCRAVHAEQNAIIQAAVHGVGTDGSTLYCTHQPCVLCAKMLINAGIRRIVYKRAYPDVEAMKILRQANVVVINID